MLNYLHWASQAQSQVHPSLSTLRSYLQAIFISLHILASDMQVRRDVALARSFGPKRRRHSLQRKLTAKLLRRKYLYNACRVPFNGLTENRVKVHQNPILPLFKEGTT
jgi:hypothetical protein